MRSDPATGPARGFRRDALTRASYTTISSWAWFIYGFGAILPLLRAEQGTSRTVMGLHSLALSAGALVAGLTTVAVVRVVRRRGAVGLGAGLVGAGTLALTVAPSPAWSLAATLLVGTGGSTMLNAAVPALTDHHGASGGAALSEANAIAAGLGVVAPLAVGAGVALGWTWRPAALVVLPLLALVAVTLRRVPAEVRAMDAGPPAVQGSHRRMGGVFYALLVMVGTCVGLEFCCTAWAADLVRQRTEVSAAVASTAVTAVVAGMTVGRASLGRLALVMAPARLVAYALVVSVAGWVVVWTSTSPGVMFAGLTVIGLGIAGLYPLGAALLMDAAAGRSDRASSRLSLAIAVSSGGGPFALGAVADAAGTHTAFLAVPLLVALAATALWSATRTETSFRWGKRSGTSPR